MSVSGAWRRWLRCPASPPESSRCGDGCFPSRRQSPSSDSSDTPHRPLGRAGAAIRALLLALSFLAAAPDAAAQTTVTIAPKVTAVTEGTNAGEPGAGTISRATFTVTRTGATASPLTVNLHVDDAPNSDFVPATAEGDEVVTINAGRASADYSVLIPGNKRDEPDGPVKVTVLPASGYQVGSTSVATITVTDNAGPTIFVAGTATSVYEGQTKTFKVSFIRAAGAGGLYRGERISVPLIFAGTADRGTSGDYTLACGSAAGVTCSNLNSGTATVLFTGPTTGRSASSVTVTLTALPDGIPDSGETVKVDAGSVKVTGSSGGWAKTEGIEFVINNNNNAEATSDDDPPALVSLPGTVEASVSNGVVRVARPSGWTGKGKVQIGGGGKKRDRGSFTTLKVGNLDADSFEVTWASRVSGTKRLTLEWQPVAGSSWRPSDGGPKDPRVLTIEDPASEPETATPDQTPVTPVVSVTAGPAVTEGGNASFTLTANPAPAGALAVKVTVGQSGDYAAPGATGTKTVTIPGGATTATYTVATAGDSTDEPNGSVTVTLAAGQGYTVHGTNGAATVDVSDDDEPLPAVSIAAKAGSVTEGTAAGFTLTASRAPAADLAVKLTVSEKAGSDFVAAGDEGGKTAVIKKGETEVVVTVATVDDAADEPDGSVTATLGAGSGYTVAAAPANAATVAVADDDGAVTAPTFSVSDLTVKEDAGQVLFTVRLSPAATRWTAVRVEARESTPRSATRNVDFYGGWRNVYFRPGQTEAKTSVYIYNDSHDDDGETFEMALSNPYGGAVIRDGVAVVTIENSDPMPAAWLARFGRTVAEQALSDIADRIAAPRTPGVEGVLAGQALGGGGGAPTAGLPARGASGRFAGIFSEDPGESWSMSLREALLSSRFTATGAVDMTGGSMAFWGRASGGSFDGREGAVSLTGETTTALLGADYARGPWLLGLALAQSEGRSRYAADSGDAAAGPDGPGTGSVSVRAGDGEVEGRLTATIPYLAFQASERLRIWGAMGQGQGMVTVRPALGGVHEAATGWTMMAAGLRGDLLAPPAQGPGSPASAGSGSGPAVAVTSDALWVRTSSEKTAGLAATEADVSRLRFGLEGSWRAALSGGGKVVPKLELGARHDGGDAETGFGVELGGGVAWVDPKLGLSLDLAARTLMAHDDEALEDRGVAASLSFDPDGASARGLSLSLSQDFGGQATGGLDALFRPEPLEDRTGSEATSRWAMEAAWGLPVLGGRFTGSPHVGLGLAASQRDYTLGWRLAPEAGNAPDVLFGLKATRRETDATEAEHTVGVEIAARW